MSARCFLPLATAVSPPVLRQLLAGCDHLVTCVLFEYFKFCCCDCQGRTIRVNEAQPPGERSFGGRGGGFGGGRGYGGGGRGGEGVTLMNSSNRVWTLLCVLA
jgi:uncharacterized membrane protein YgcG